MADDLAPNQPTQDEDKRRKRLLFLFLFLLLVVVFVVVFFVASSGDEPVAATTSTQPTAPAATTTSDPQTTTTTLAASTTTTAAPTVSGVWDMTVDVTVAMGACSGKEGHPDDEIEPDIVTIDQDGGSISVLGLGYPKDTQVWEGTIEGNTVTFGGTREEDDGITTALFTMTVDYVAGTMSGIENWTWEGPGGTCPGSESEVTASLSGP